MDDKQVQELDRILKLWANSYNPQIEPELPLNTGCQHQSQLYIGFREEYEFCVKCDAKRLNGVWSETDKSH